MNSPTSTSSSTSSSIGPITGEESTSVLQAEAFNSPIPQSKVGLSPFENESLSLHSVCLKKIGFLRVNSQHPIFMALTLTSLSRLTLITRGF